jgi:hypothetical protein
VEEDAPVMAITADLLSKGSYTRCGQSNTTKRKRYRREIKKKYKISLTRAIFMYEPLETSKGKKCVTLWQNQKNKTE